MVSLKTTTDIGGLNGRSCDIAVSVNCYYNKEAIQSVSGTKIEGVAAGFSKTALTEIVGKTSGEIKSPDFVKLLNNNISAGVLGATIEKVNTHLAQVVSSNGFNHCNYYDGTRLLAWSLHDKIVGF